MAKLISCPACQAQVSDQAPACPKCGHPIAPTAAPVKRSGSGCLPVIVVAVVFLWLVWQIRLWQRGDEPKAPVPPAPPAVSTLSFRDIQSKADTLSELAFKDYAQSLKGTRVRWSGVVIDAGSTFGQCALDVDVNHNNLVDVLVPGVCSEVKAFDQHTPIVFEGPILDVSTTLKYASVIMSMDTVVERVEK